MSFLRIRDVEPLDGFRVRLRLTDDTTLERDLTALLAGPVFESIRDPEVFRLVRVEAGTIAWPSGPDLCPDVLIWGGAPPVQRTERQATGAPSA